MKQILMSAEIDGYFTNHSLCRSSCTRLFQAGVDRKIVTEMFRHRSDAIDKYQVTSEFQKKHVSNMISNETEPKEAKVVESESEEICDKPTKQGI